MPDKWQQPKARSGSGAIYTMADVSTCKGALTFDDRDLGFNNQLASLSYMLCAAHITHACSLYMPPLGYIPCGTHMPGVKTRRGPCSVPASHAATDVRQLLKIPPDILELLQRGDEMANRTKHATRCQKAEVSPACGSCTPYMTNPFNCLRNEIGRMGRVHMTYAYGLRYHVRDHAKQSKKPSCPLMELMVARDVELYARKLMNRLGLVAGEFVTAQLRTGWAWRVHTRKANMGWACYGMRTINATLAKLGAWDAAPTSRQQPPDSLPARRLALTERPRFLLTNSRNLHDVSVPVPVQILAEIFIVSLSHTVVLNQMSSFQHAVIQMRRSMDGVHFIQKRDVVLGDSCGCSAADEKELEKMGKVGKFRDSLCSNNTAFEEWMLGVKKREANIIVERRQTLTSLSLRRNASRIAIDNK